MIYKILTVASIIAITNSCEKKQMEATYLENETTATTPANGVTTTPATTGVAPGTTIETSAAPSQSVTINPTAPANSAKTATAPGMNPPHGEPGHRCDIPVGSSLSQPVKSGTGTAPASPAAAVIPSAPVSSPAPQATAPGMNPPHGQPGHRCDIAVGAPLSSPPSNAATTVPAAK